MTKSFFERFTEWQNYVHYVLLWLGVSIFTHSLSFSLLLIIFIVDTLVHGLFWIMPRPYRWRD